MNLIFFFSFGNNKEKVRKKGQEKEDKPESRRRLSSGPPRVRAQVQLRGEKEDAAEYAAISPRLCLAEQLSWQMTLLHTDKRGLQASPACPPPPLPPPPGRGWGWGDTR